MIVTRELPRRDDIVALAARLRFVKDHRMRIRRLAIATDDRLLSAMPHLANHSLVREARHFQADEEGPALAWLGQPGAT